MNRMTERKSSQRTIQTFWNGCIILLFDYHAKTIMICYMTENNNNIILTYRVYDILIMACRDINE